MLINGATENDISTPCEAYNRMLAHWGLIHDLLGGTVRMRAAQTKWLPKEPKEQDQSYMLRLGRSVLYEGYEDTIEKLAAKPFSKLMTVENEKDLDARLHVISKNANRDGQTLHAFAHLCYMDGLNYGLFHILVDYPPNINDKGEQYTPNVQEERDRDIRPYFCRIAPLDMFFWRFTRDSTNKRVLTEIRYYQTYTEETSNEGLVEKKEIIQYKNDKIVVHRRAVIDQKEQWVPFKTIANTLKKVPLVTKYFKPLDLLEAEPPLEGLAWLNLAHWQSSSDQRHCLRFARVSMIFMSGVSEDEKNAETVVGPNRIIKSVNPEAKAYHVEHTGAAITAGAHDLKHLEEQMQVLGLQPLVESTGYTTATGRGMDEAKSHSKAQEWVFSTEAALIEAYTIACEWIKKIMPTTVKVKIFSDFTAALQAGQEIQSLYTSARDGLTSIETYVKEMRRRGVYSEEVDINAEIASVKAERARLEKVNSQRDAEKPKNPQQQQGTGGATA